MNILNIILLFSGLILIFTGMFANVHGKYKNFGFVTFKILPVILGVFCCFSPLSLSGIFTINI